VKVGARLVAVLALASLFGGAACGGGSAGSEPARPPIAKKPSKSGAGLPALHAANVASVPKGTFGPYVGKEGDQALLVWAAEEQPGVRSWFTLPVVGGAPVGESKKLAPAPAELGVVAVRGVGEKSFALVSSRKNAGGEQVEVALIGADGKLAGPSQRLGEANRQVLWVDAANLGGKRLVLYGVRSEGGADLMAVPVGARGEPIGDAQTFARDVRAWQIAPAGDVLAVGVVRSSSERGASGPVEVLWIGAGATPIRPATRLSGESTAELDLDLALVGERLVVMWSDRRFGEARLVSAELSRSGAITAEAAPFTAPLGEQALLRLVSSGERAYAVWENLSGSEQSGRAFEVSAVGPDARAGKERARVTYASDDGSVPEVTASSRGVSFITLGPACVRGAECDRDAIGPSYLTLGPSLDVAAYEPLRLDALSSEAADLAWGLTCLERSCFALTAQNTSPARVMIAELEPKSAAWQAPAEKLGVEPPPRVEETSVLATTEPLAVIAYERRSNGGLLGWLTAFDPSTPWARLKTPAKDGRFDPERSFLMLAPVTEGNDGPRVGAPFELSRRAHSLGGLSLLPAKPDAKESVLGWVGFDGGEPQVFLSSISPEGKKLDQRMLTRKKGGASDVSVVFVGDGYVVGWIDERSGAPEVYAAKVDLRLNRVSLEQRLTRAPAVPSELTASADSTGALLVWSDASDGAGGERADLHGLRLTPKAAAPEGKELRLSETPAHSFSPALCRRGEETVLAWLERAEGEGEHALMLGVLDARGGWKSSPERAALGGGTPAALDLDCTADVERLALLSTVENQAELSVIERRRGRFGAAKTLARLPDGSATDQRPVLRGDEILFEEAAPTGQHRIRRLKVVWE
jgi:hypothetical protein